MKTDLDDLDLSTFNIMKTKKMRKRFSGSGNPMSKENPNSKDAREKVSIALKGRTSKLKDRTYEDIHGPEKAESLKNNRSEYFKQKFQPDLEKLMNYLNLELIDETYQGAHYKHNWKCKTCKTEFLQIWNALQQGYQCPVCFPRYMGDSKPEREIREYIESLGFNPIYNSKKIIPPKEIDIFIPEKNIAIEHNGLYFHNTEKISKSYHIKKTIACKKLGIQLIHIFEDEWVYKNDIVKERLKYILGCSTGIKINGRDCIIQTIPNKQKDEFLKEYHIQGPDIGSSINLGAFHNDILVSVMTFCKENKSRGNAPARPGYWELNRFASNPGYLVRGISSKLLKYFKTNYDWLSIISYADRRWSTGNVYNKLNFNFKGYTSLDYWYSNGSLSRISRSKMRRRKDEPQDIPEYILRIKEGYFRVFGCGNLKFEMINTSE